MAVFAAPLVDSELPYNETRRTACIEQPMVGLWCDVINAPEAFGNYEKPLLRPRVGCLSSDWS
jgi:hypothetical protein